VYGGGFAQRHHAADPFQNPDVLHVIGGVQAFAFGIVCDHPMLQRFKNRLFTGLGHLAKTSEKPS
jgi:hypothetical protein